VFEAVLSLSGGLVGLVIAGTLIVSGASTIGLRLGLSPIVVGLTIVAAGTSAPELAVVWQAADQGDPGLALGSVIGSNIANILLVVGLVAVVGGIPVGRDARYRDLPVMVIASFVTFLLARDGAITSTDGAILLAGLVAYLGWTLRIALTKGSDAAAGANAGATPDPRPDLRRTLLAIGAFVVGAIGVAFAAGFVVGGAEEIAISLGVPELVVGLTVLAVGTSAPEIVTSVIAAARGNRDVAIGNAIGSNIFNLLFVLGLVSVTHSDLPVADALIGLDLPVMLAAAALCVPFAITGAEITRLEGIALMGFYAAYTTYLVLDGLENAVADVVGIATLAAIVPLAIVIAVDLRRSRADASPPASTDA